MTASEALNPSLAAIVLAGGKSSRMGRDKALIEINGVPLLRQVCEVALQCCPIVYVVTPRLEQYQPILPAHCYLIPEVPLPNEPFPHGALVGFAQGLAAVQTEWVLLLACDLPQLEAEFFCRSRQKLPHLGEAIALLPKGKKGWEPLCGFYHRSCLVSLNAAIDRGDRSFQRWLTDEIVDEMVVSDRSMLFNCNTPADLEQVMGD